MEPDENQLDQLAVLRAQLDQSIALIPDLARITRAWYDGLRKEGFTDTAALYLTAVHVLRDPGKPA